MQGQRENRRAIASRTPLFRKNNCGVSRPGMMVIARRTAKIACPRTGYDQHFMTRSTFPTPATGMKTS